MSIEKDFINTMHSAMDSGIEHIPYSQEMNFYELVRQGELEALEKMNPQLLVEGQGILSKDQLHNARYHFVIATAFITRFCIENGMQKEEAYTLSDIYIRKMDETHELEEIKVLHHEMVFAFAGKMKELRKTSASSLYIRSAIDYISNHITSSLKIKDIAEHIGLSEKYLSTLFKKETGQTVISYIEERQMEAAGQMLIYTSRSYAEISDSLSFCSQSYFSKVFKKHYGMTPMQYRMKYSDKKFI